MNYKIGIDIGGTNIKIGLVDNKNSVVYQRIYSTPSDSYENLIDVILNGIALLKQDYELRFVGIGCAGIVDFQKGKVVYSPNIDYLRDKSLKDDLEKKLELPVSVDNDANVIAIGEKIAGVSNDINTLICLTLGTGVGSGIIIDNHLLRGKFGGAGELGHTIIDIDGPLCNCGSKGCLEAFIGISAIENRAREFYEITEQDIPENLSPKYIGHMADRNDKVALQIIHKTAFYLGIGLANFINIFAPELIVITGGISGWNQHLLIPAQKIARENAMPYLAGKTEIIKSSLGYKAGIIGAANIRLF